ncbi:quinone oxidoreductase family protein [Demequina sp. SO4-13]|uniref:quinone oxidoreductase family protein n=1 Tax=Demequina sp. SO4-13 TaxID=3401027 RepID=UPI003AF8B931
MRAIQADTTGGPDELQEVDVPDPELGPDQVLVDVAASGVNFIDTYQRSGVYDVKRPFRPGLEGAGVVVEVGADVDWAAPGDRLAWAGTLGSYAERVALSRHDAYRVPDGVELDTAAALMLQGLTAHFLSASCFPLAPGHTALVHAGAGGVGLLLTQLAAARGARVITTVSRDDKEALSRAAGASEVIRYEDFTDMSEELPRAVRGLTDGEGVDVVYDGVGAATFDGSLASLAVRGTLVLFGGASGQVPPFDLQRLNSGGSLSVTRPSMVHYLRTDDERSWRAEELFSAVSRGDLDVRIGATYPLAEASAAHRALEARGTTGKVLLLP